MLSALYEELAESDQEHGDVSVCHDESLWCMAAHRDGRLVFVQLDGEGGGPRHMIPVPKDQVIQFWHRLIDGDIEGLLNEPWRPGYV
jgi:hypothetical protein